jgi:DNA-binding transcriptional ArsR family regulator
MKETIDFHSFELELSKWLNVAHPAKIQIISILSKHKDRTCKEIVAELPLSQSTVSKHFKRFTQRKDL